MIGDPVALTIRRNIERPSKSVMKAFAGMPTGFVTDACNGIADHVRILLFVFRVIRWTERNLPEARRPPTRCQE